MTAWNVVRFRVKPGRDADFIAAHKKVTRSFPGMRKFSLFKFAERSYCVVGEWKNFDSLAKARPNMIAILDSFRDTLEDLGGGMGVTDPISGEALVEIAPVAKKSGAKKPASGKSAGKKKPAGKKPKPAAKKRKR